MDSIKKVIFKGLMALILTVAITGLYSCNKSYPCPGNGQSSAADLSLFDEDGNPVGSGRKKKGGNGLVNKKTPKKIRRKSNLRLE